MKIAPLKGKTAFASTMRSGKRFTGQIITGIVKYRSLSESVGRATVESVESDMLSITLGVSIRKKTAKKATVRNRAKRLLRQSVRMIIREFADAGYFADRNPFDKVIIFCNSAPATASQMHIDDILSDVRVVLQSAFDYSQKYSLINENNTHRSYSRI